MKSLRPKSKTTFFFFFFLVLKDVLCSPRLHLFDYKYSKTVILWNIINILINSTAIYSGLQCHMILQKSFYFFFFFLFFFNNVKVFTRAARYIVSASTSRCAMFTYVIFILIIFATGSCRATPQQLEAVCTGRDKATVAKRELCVSKS